MRETPAPKPSQQLITRVGYAGLLPFALCLFYAWLHGPGLPAFLFVTWSAIVQAFVVGSLWGMLLFADGEALDRRPAVIAIALIAMTAWTALSLGDLLWSGIALVVGHLITYAVERRFFLDLQPGWYQRLRLLLVSVVSIMHGLLILRVMI